MADKIDLNSVNNMSPAEKAELYNALKVSEQSRQAGDIGQAGNLEVQTNVESSTSRIPKASENQIVNKINSDPTGIVDSKILESAKLQAVNSQDVLNRDVSASNLEAMLNSPADFEKMLKDLGPAGLTDMANKFGSKGKTPENLS